MSASISRSWLTYDQLVDLAPGTEVRLLAASQVIFRKNSDGSWDELDRPAVQFTARRCVPTATLFLLGVEDVI